MKDLSEAKQKLIKDLFKNKKFHQLEFEVNSLLLEKKSSFLLNLLGVSKISNIPTSKKDLNESLDLFKEAYLKDKTLIDALFNLSFDKRGFMIILGCDFLFSISGEFSKLLQSRNVEPPLPLISLGLIDEICTNCFVLKIRILRGLLLIK